MGVYIKGMKKPKSCDKCPLSLWALPKGCFLEIEACPITELKTPHGRLGDLDYVAELLKEYAEEYSEVDEKGLHSEKWCGYMECIETLKTIPIRIEAEVE